MSVFEKKTNWLPLVAYNEAGNDYIVFARKGKSGMLYFRIKKVTPHFACSYNFTTKLLDIKEQFDKILNQ